MLRPLPDAVARWAPAVTAIAASTLLLSMQVIAADADQGGPSYPVLFAGAVSLVSLLIGALVSGYTRAMMTVLRDTRDVAIAARDGLAKLQLQIAERHPDRDGVQSQIASSLQLIDHRLGGIEGTQAKDSAALREELTRLRDSNTVLHRRMDDIQAMLASDHDEED